MPVQWIPDSARERPGHLDLGNGWELHRESKLEHCFRCDRDLALYRDVLRRVYVCDRCMRGAIQEGDSERNFPWTGVVYKSEGDEMSYTRKQFEDVARILRVQVERTKSSLERTKSSLERAYQADNQVGGITESGKISVLKDVAEDFAAYFAFDNEAFDKERFLASAGFTAA